MNNFVGAVSVDIARKRLGKNSKSEFHSPLSVSDSIQIIKEYGYMMLNKSPACFYISDVSGLPYPKDTIKAALMMVLSVNGKEQIMDVLKIGYLQLANWQEGVGDVDLAIGAVYNDEAVMERIKRVTAQYEEVDKWNAILAKERMRLKDDLISIGVW